MATHATAPVAPTTTMNSMWIATPAAPMPIPGPVVAVVWVFWIMALVAIGARALWRIVR